MNDVRRFSLRRTIASLLVAAECFSLAAVGVPVSYAEEQIQMPEQTEQIVLSPETEEEALTAEENEPVQEPAAVTPLEAARMGAETAEQLAEQAERAAEEAEQAARDCAEAEGDYELTLDAGARAAEASRRAQEIAGRAKEEADWAAEAASIAAGEAETAAQEAETLAYEAELAEELAYQTAEEADRLREEVDLKIERINEISATAEPIDRTEEKKSEKSNTKEKGIELVEETSTPGTTGKRPETKTDSPLPTAQEKEKEAAENMLEQAIAEAERTKEEAAMKREEAERAAENAAFLTEEAEQAAYAASIAMDAANRAAASADRAAEANLYAAEASSIAAEIEAERIAKLEQEKASEETEETIIETAAEETKEETKEEATEETKEEAKEETKEETKEEAKEETKEETKEEAKEVETLDYSDGAVAVTGEVPAGTTVETAEVIDKYADFDPSVYSVLSMREAPTFFAAESDTQRTTETKYKVLAAYDISLTVEGEEYQPASGSLLTVSISDPDISEDLLLQVWHIRDDGTGQQVYDFNVEGNSVTFPAESFSAYLVVQVTVTTYITTGDGDTYRVSVTYDQDADMPENADLAVRELGDDEKEDYVNQSAETLGTDAEDFTFARAFDISLIDPETGGECQPASGVKVSISLLDTDVSAADELSLLHFGKEVETVSYTLNDGAVEFETDGFSVYVLAGVTTYTVTFKAIDPELSVYTQYGDVQTVKVGEKPFIPQPPSSNNLEFAGWYEEDEQNPNQNPIRLSDTPYDFSGEPESDSVVLYAKYTRYAYVIFHDQYDSASGTWPVAHTRRAELTGEEGSQSAQVRIDDLSAPYTGSAKVAFCGWSYSKVTTPGVYLDADNNNISFAIDSASITIQGDTHLYPIYRPTHWLTFYSAQSGLGADYIPPQEIFDGDGLASLPVPRRGNYVFQGWYTGTLVTTTVNGKPVETVNFSHQVTDADGKLTDGSSPYLTEPDGGVSFSNATSKLALSADATLYARWSAEYHVVIWRQNVTDPIDDDDTNNHYDEYFETLTRTAEIGSTVNFDGSEASYAGYAFVSSDGPKTIANTEEVTTLNAYYKLTAAPTLSGSYTLTFADSEEGTGVAMPHAYDGSDAEHPKIPYDAPLNALSIQSPDNRKSDNGYTIYTFKGWYLDQACTIPADLAAVTMPNRDLTLYAGWEAVWFIVTIDPNYGALYYYDGGVLKGSGATWFWQSYDSELIGEYTHTTRNYVPSSSGSYYYVNHVQNQGYSDRYTYYTQNITEATEDTTFEYAPGSYTYNGWYEVCDDGSEKPFDFNQKPDHAITLRLHWKRNGQFYLGFNPGSGILNIEDGETAVLPEAYSDNANITISRTATSPGYAFIGWRVRGDSSGTLYTPGDLLTLQAEYAVRESGKDIVWLDAVYKKLEFVTIVYHANDGQMSESPDPGSIPGKNGDPSTPIPTTNIIADPVAGTLRVTGLENNSPYTLSSGKLKTDSSTFAFTKDGAELVGWSNASTYDPANAETQLFALGDTVGVDLVGGSVTDLHAVWQVKVTYHLDGKDKPDSAAWSAAWSASGSDSDYTQNVYLNTAAAEPGAAYIPTCDSEHMFYYWATRTGEGTEASPYVYPRYTFSDPVTGPLDLYAVWDGLVEVPTHAVDASNETLTVTDVADIEVGTEPVTLKGKANPPTDYAYAFAVALSSTATRDNVSEADAITQIYYNQAEKHLYVQYADPTRADAILNEGTEIYFIYYQKKSLPIAYKSMDANGVLTAVTPDNEAPVTLVGEYDMANNVTSPLAWASGDGYYAFAVGSEDAANASQLHGITQTSNSDSSLPTLRLHNTWQGFRYTTDGGADPVWNDCGFAPQLYVVYFDQKPTVVILREETVGTDAVMGTEFEYRLVVEQTVTTGEGATTTTVYDSDAVDDGNGGTTQHIYKLKNGESQSAVLFYSNVGGTERTQTITVTQKETAESGAFTTLVGETETKTWTSAPSSADGGTQTVTFTNKHKSLPVEVHVALLEGGKAVLKDNAYRANDVGNYRFDLTLGASADFLTKLPSATVFTGDTMQYALGAIMYGTDNDTTVTVAGMGVSSISYGRIGGNSYELLLDGSADKPLGENKIYYLYYPMPQIRYVKETADGLAEVSGADNVSTPNTERITYNYDQLTMNGDAVAQGQRVTIPVNGRRVISQSGNQFRMPPNLDDGIYAAYLSYIYIGAGDANKTSLGGDETANGRTLYLRVSDSAVQYSFTGAGDTWHDFTGTPTIYAVYEERGYDLMLNKNVDMSASGSNPLFSGASFPVAITSAAITKSSYNTEGFDSASIGATPADGSEPGRIELTVKDGTSVRIEGLGQGEYTVTEYDNQNFVLTAKRGNIVSGGTTTPVEGITALSDGSGRQFSIALNSETRLDLINTPQQLCQIVDGGTTHIFYTFADALQYVEDEISTQTATIEMLSDYLIPTEDVVEIPFGWNITLKTAENKDGVAVITRSSTLTNKPLIKNYGALILENIILDGASVQTTEPLIESESNLTVGSGAVLKNANKTGNGGAIFATDGNITVIGEISDNKATEKGAAIYYTGSGTISMDSGAELCGNKAGTDGGAVYAAQGAIVLSGTAKFENNAAAGNGGAICVGNASITIDQAVKLTGNQAQSGGAIYAGTATITISETEHVTPPSISNNTATEKGGAICIGTGTIAVSGGRISSNGEISADPLTVTEKGGAIYAGSAAVSISGTAALGSNKAQSGGAVYAESGNVSVDLTTGSLSNNTATTGDGGAVYADSGNVTLSGGSVTGNEANGTAENAGNGGAVYAKDGAVNVSGVTLTGNSAVNGGALYAQNGAVTVTNGKTESNKASEKGGAVYADRGNVTVSLGDENSLSKNTAKNGGAIYAQSGKVTLSGGSMSENKANGTGENDGGGLVRAGTGEVSVTGVSVTNNEASNKHGGAVYAGTGAVTFTNCTAVTGNKATANGGVICADGGTVTVSDSSFGGTDTGAGNSAVNGGAVYAGTGSVSVTGSSMKGNKATANGGAICTDTGSVSATNATFGGTDTGAGNSAVNGGAIYSHKGAVSLTGGSVVKNSATTDGGGVYAGEGAVTLSGTPVTGNTATGGKGGAFYAGAGAVGISGTGALTENTAKNGGAFYMGSGIANLASVSVQSNTTTDGSAIFVKEGSIYFDGGTVEGNTSTNGGGVGGGSITARLYLKGNVQIKDNTLGTGENAPKANIYLDQDSNDIINITGIGTDAYIGVYVPDDMLDKRGVPGATFASYTSTDEGNITDARVKNDRHSFTVKKDADGKKLYWGKEIPVQLRYLASYNGDFPPTNAGVGVYKSGSYYPTLHDAAFSELAAGIYKGLTATELARMTDTANYGGAFLWSGNFPADNSTVTMGDYITAIRWDSAGQKWKVTKWDGTEEDLGNKKIVIYYTEPAYIAIENNTDMPLNISNITVGGKSLISTASTAGYGILFAKNGAIRSALLPATEDDLKLAVNASVTLLIPSGQNLDYTLNGQFETTTGETVDLRTGSSESTPVPLSVGDGGSFDPISGTTLNTSGTYQIIFGSDKEICKVVDNARVEYTFPKISEALDFIKNPSASTRYPGNGAAFDANGTTGKKATIQMLTDYLLPASDPVVVPRGYDITLTTAEVEPGTPVEGVHYYKPSAEKIAAGETRATLSRDSENTESMIDGFVGAPANNKSKDNTILRISDLMFDGKSVRGGSNGGVVSTKYCDVYVDHVDFKNVYAQNGGALFVVYNVNLANTNPAQATVANTRLEVRNSTFTNCYSKPSQKAGESKTEYENRIKRMGGGAIIAGTANLVLDSCTFENCQADDQAGAVFHRVDGNYNSNTTINNCTFTNCRAKAAGGLEIDSKYITVTNTSFSTCVATDRNGGGFNVYALNSATPTAECKVTLKGCSFTNCQAKNFGGGFRSTATHTKVMDCSFTSCSARNGDGSGGAIGISSANAIKAEIYACKLTGCEATKLGGGIYYVGSELIVGDTYNHTYTGTDNQEHTVTGTGTMSITNCTATNEGGGIYSGKDGGTLTMTNVVITGNTSRNQSGGGIYTKAGTVTISGGSVSNNTSTNQGGGIYQTKDGTFTMTGTAVNGNTSTGNTGGGVHTAAKTVTITGGSISNNTASKDGGGLYSNAKTSLTIKGTSISGNTSKNNSGGGVWYDGADDVARAVMKLDIQGCTIDGNSANYGGGVYTQVKTVTIGDYTYTDASSQQQTEHTSISNNTAKNHGGGLYHSREVEGSTLSITNASIDGNRITVSGKLGGGIYTNVRTLTISGGSVSGNTATNNGGGLWYDSSSTDATTAENSRKAMSLSLSGCAIDGNTSGGDGGGIYTQVKTLQVGSAGDTHMSVSNNTAAKAGGGIYQHVVFSIGGTYQIIEGAALTITDASICDNTARGAVGGSTGSGGGVYSLAPKVEIIGATISRNVSAGDGGGVHAFNRFMTSETDSVKVEGSIFEQNRASGNGGAINTNVSRLDLGDRDLEGSAVHSRISDCTAGNSGGGLFHNRYEDTVKTVLTNCTVEGCRANGTADITGTNGRLVGGGAVFSNTGELSMTGVTLRNNTAVNKGGGVLYDYYRAGFYDSKPDSGGLTVDGCTLTRNTAAMGGAVYTRSYMRLRNGSEITNNRLSTSNAANAAGVYLPDNITLVVGIKDAESDTVIVRDNYTDAGGRSNLRLWSNSDNQNNEKSIYVYCNLSTDSEVRVVNAYKIGTKFGESAIENPIGFTQGFTNDFSVFKADDDSLKGVIDRAQGNYQSIIWGGPAVCKITDGSGNLLYLRVNSEGKGADPAVFDRLDTGNPDDKSIISAFSLLRMEKTFNTPSFTGPELYTAEGQLYTGTDYCVKMLDNFTTLNSVIINEKAGRHITLTTASREDPDYPFEYSKKDKEKTNTTRATVLCGESVGESLISTKANLTIENIILDGGSLGGHTGTRILEIDQPEITAALKGEAILRNTSTTGDGGGILVKQGSVEIGVSGTGGSGGYIRNCNAQNGGGIAMEVSAGTITFSRGNIFQCSATVNGGGVYQNAGSFTMTNGSIEGCMADKGGGVFVANDMSFDFSGSSGSIRGNRAASEGGGIAVGGLDTRLYFSERPTVSGNTCSVSVAPKQACNVELNTNMVAGDDTNAVIQVKKPGLQNKAYIGVYVAGTDNETPTSIYDYHGKEAKPFATYEDESDTNTFYSFVNDRNGLKGGLIAGKTDNFVYWVKIFSLELSLRIESSVEIPTDEEFEFTVVLEGDANVSGQASAKDIFGEYGDMTFISDGASRTTATVTLKLGDGDSWETGVSCKAENLSAGLDYTVTVKPTEEQKKKYAVMPTSYKGKVGENNDASVQVEESERYISRAPFVAVLAVCKLTYGDGNLLYYYYTDARGNNWHVPAVFKDLPDAVAALNETLYSGVNLTDPAYNAEQYGVSLEMLVQDYTLPSAVALPSDIPLTLTTASEYAEAYPYRGATTTVSRIARGAGVDGSMFAVNDSLELRGITLDGVKSSYTAAADGGIVHVNNGGSLTVGNSATLQKSKTTGSGGAVYVSDGGSLAITGGTITENEALYGGAVYIASGGTGAMSGGMIEKNRASTGGNGAGIYLAAGSTLELSGSPGFGSGTSHESIAETYANYAGKLTAQQNGGKPYKFEHQDIYLAETGAEPASLVLKSNLTGSEGSIWIWADNTNRYAMANAFAKVDFDKDYVTDETYHIFRNAQTDGLTFVSDGKYLTGDNEREKDGFIHWTGGYDVLFRKTDSFGNVLKGATFKLFTNAACTASYQRNGDVTATASDGNAKTGSGTTIPEGTVLFEKLPAGVYYMKESAAPSGYAANDNIYLLLVGQAELGKYNTYGLENADVTKQTEQYQTDYTAFNVKGDYALFLYENGSAKAQPDIAKYGVLNLSSAERKVILRKVTEGTYAAIENAEFQIERVDGSLVESTDINGTNTTTFTSGANGVYFIDKLSYGVYYLHEMTPAVKWFFLVVNQDTESGSRDGVYVSEACETLDAAKTAYEAYKAASDTTTP